jgi:type 1 glutamine amidotransferase
MRRLLLPLALPVSLAAPGCSSPPTDLGARDAGAASAAPPSHAPRVLLYTKETEWFHPSTPVATEVMLARGAARGWEVTATKESTGFTDEALAGVDVLVFLNSSGITMDGKQRDAFAAWVASGHGWVGVHAASHTDYDWTFMHALVGATFCCHPPIMPAYLDVQDRSDPIVAHLPARWAHTDEWYTYDRRPEDDPRIKVLLTLDEKSAHPDYPGPDLSPVLRVGYHATTWKHELGATRSFYTGLGHTVESWADDRFVTMIVKAVEWAGEPRAR